MKNMMKSFRKRVKDLPGVRRTYVYLRDLAFLRRHYKFGTKHSLLSLICAYNKAYRNEMHAQEFCYLRYMDLSEEERRQIVPWEEQFQFFIKVNPPEMREVTKDKYRAYELFKEYYKREVIKLTGDVRNDEKTFLDFSRRNGKLIIKPMEASKGTGIRIIDAEALSDKELLDVLGQYNGEGVAEALIVQSDVVGAFHPKSVNTLRINTVRYDDEVEVKWPCFRVGRGDTEVDNAGAGGIFAAIDEKTGVTLKAADEYGNRYTHHPDTNLSLIGFQIPEWDGACEMVRCMAQKLPGNRFIAWDLAYTDNGWVMVEGNALPLIIWQIAMCKGIREDFESMEKRLGLSV